MTPDRALALNGPIVTERLSLEPLTIEHASAFFGPLQNQELYRWISSGPPESVEGLSERWARSGGRIAPNGNDAWLGWAVRRRRDGEYVGKMDAAVSGANVALNIGYIFFLAFWGHGYATEAVVALSQHLARHDVTELWATVTLGNFASVRVLEKAGFARTRILSENDTIRGIKCDEVEFVRRAAGRQSQRQPPPR